LKKEEFKQVLDIKEAINQVKAVHSCSSCFAHLTAIKEHTKNGHKDE
jgi:hypothetical protein